MFPSWQSLLSCKPIKMESQRRAADGIQPDAIIDLTMQERIGHVPKRLSDGNNGLYLCPICIDPPEQPVATMCGHVFCRGCLIPALLPLRSCPMCKESVSRFIRLYT
ncbi:uncharacterized protein LOC127010691 [Drosophila biarmipes]|uniref:uncharacterized protein LOC127010691 n=1 Tax=Drosophila biarmipes TaxID=125945 RepID=UPI0007E6EF22|nr:uncharacterized protein LOC127010691 [Drosophila biarmipes]